MRALFGCGTPREAASAKNALFFVIQTDAALAIGIIAEIDGEVACLPSSLRRKQIDQTATSSPHCYEQKIAGPSRCGGTVGSAACTGAKAALPQLIAAHSAGRTPCRSPIFGSG